MDLLATCANKSGRETSLPREQDKKLKKLDPIQYSICDKHSRAMARIRTHRIRWDSKGFADIPMDSRELTQCRYNFIGAIITNISNGNCSQESKAAELLSRKYGNVTPKEKGSTLACSRAVSSKH